MSNSDSKIRESKDWPRPDPLVSYTCPGELYSIPRSIHLARLAAFYSACQGCPHRFDTGHALPSPQPPEQSGLRPVVRESLVSGESVRGVYLNELDRNRAIAWGEAFAAHLWDRQPMVSQPIASDRQQIVDSPAQDSPSIRRGPTVVVGFDERPSSPDIVSGLVLGLRRMGCPVVDVGQSTLPCLAFQIDSLTANAGVYVTGAGCDPSSTGFEFLSGRGFPIPAEALRHVEQSLKAGVPRQTRQIGGYETRHGQADYDSSLLTCFHALRPLQVVCGTSTRILPRAIDRLFARLPCRVIHVPLPSRRRDLFDPRDSDLQRVATTVIDGKHHLGLVIDDDGRHMAFITDHGRLVLPQETARLLVEMALRENPRARIVVATSWQAEVRRWLSGREAVITAGGESVAELVQTMSENNAALALAADGRAWFQLQYPACDAVITMGSLLQALSLSDAPFSEVVARIGGE